MKYLLTAINFLTTFIIYAQKLPNVQTVSLRAPVNIKIDGIATEWNDQFQAYNKNIKVYYSITNDDENIYLVIQSEDEVISQKIVRGGVTFAVSTSGSKIGKNDPLITFPQYIKTEDPEPVAYNKIPMPLRDDSVKNKTYFDSLARARNVQLTAWLKSIGVSHLAGIVDEEISIYNEDGIKAALRFESNLQCIYELAVPLKYLSLNIAGPAKFIYQIRLNGMAVNGTNIRNLR